MLYWYPAPSGLVIVIFPVSGALQVGLVMPTVGAVGAPGIGLTVKDNGADTQLVVVFLTVTS